MKIFSFDGIRCILPGPTTEGQNWTRFQIGSYYVYLEKAFHSDFLFKCAFLEFDLKSKPKTKTATYYGRQNFSTLICTPDCRIGILEDYFKEIGFTLQ